MGKSKVLLEKDNGVNAKKWKKNMVVIAGRSLAITLYYLKKLWFGVILNQIKKRQIKSKSNHTFSKWNPCSSNQIIMYDLIMIEIK